MTSSDYPDLERWNFVEPSPSCPRIERTVEWLLRFSGDTDADGDADTDTDGDGDTDADSDTDTSDARCSIGPLARRTEWTPPDATLRKPRPSVYNCQDVKI